MADINSLYPQPVGQSQQPPNLLANPAAVVGLADAAQRLSILRDQAPALSALPGAQLQNQQAAYTAALLAQQADARRTVAAQFGSAVGAMTNPTPDDVHSFTAYFARSNPQIAVQYPDMINAAADVILNHPRGIKYGANQLLNTAVSPDNVVQPTAAAPTASGQPQSQPLGQANLQGTRVIGTPSGFAERQAGGAQLDTQLAGNLANAAEGSPSRRAILGNLDQLVTQFTSGPGADWTKVAKAFVNRNVPLPAGWQFDPSSIASQEEFGKQATQLAQQQFQAIGGTGTDAKFSSAFETNPNDALSQLGNKRIIALLKGNEDALLAKNNAWLQASTNNPNLSYRQFSGAFTQNFDPRAYQFKYLNQSERQAAFDAMNPDERQRFLQAVTYARKNGYVSY
jgi:hypothetical protein